jgi:hypothetical protein
MSPPAYVPELKVASISAASPSKAPTGGSFQLTPSGCSGAACSGFRVSNAQDYSSRTNVAAMTPASKAANVDPWNPGSYELGSFQLTNGGFAVPADGGAALIPLSLSLTLATPESGKSTALTVPFLVNWSPGSPAGPNNAGLFVLVTKASGSTPAPSREFSVGMTAGIDFKMKLELQGFVADPASGKDTSVLGDWGQQPPPAGQPGPRVFVKQGAGPQTVRLMGRISKID